MSPRLKLAAEAQKLNRRIFASLPLNIRVATALRALIKLAFSDDETSLGLAVIFAMNKAGVQGDLFGAPMEDIAKMLKGSSSKLYKLALQTGNSLLKKIKGTIAPDLREAAVQKVIADLYNDHGLIRHGVTAPEAFKFISNRVVQTVMDIKKTKKFKQERLPSETPSFDDVVSDPNAWSDVPDTVVRPIYRALQSNPIFLDDQGNPRMYHYLAGIIDGQSERETAEQLGMSSAAFRKWLAVPARASELKKVLRPLMDFYAYAAA